LSSAFLFGLTHSEISLYWKLINQAFCYRIASALRQFLYKYITFLNKFVSSQILSGPMLYRYFRPLSGAETTVRSISGLFKNKPNVLPKVTEVFVPSFHACNASSSNGIYGTQAHQVLRNMTIK
jgi:hypothetical protein